MGNGVAFVRTARMTGSVDESVDLLYCRQRPCYPTSLDLLYHASQSTKQRDQPSVTSTKTVAHTADILVIPRTKHIASKILDLPEPLRPVIALNEESQPVIVVRTG